MMENEMERHEVPEADRVVENVPENTGRAMLTFICVLAAFLLLLVSIGRWFPLRETKQGTLTYDVYSGPVMPLTVQGDAAGITASREINFDLSAYAGTAQEFLMLDPSADVTDAYTLTNASLEDRTLTLLYPVIGSIFDCPEVTVDGSDAALTLHAGPYSGHFDDAISGGLNLVEARCFADYQDLLADGSYMNAALADFPERDAPVTVYRLHDYVYSRATDAANPTLSMDFRIDPQKTCVFTYGSNGGSRDPATGCCSVRKGGIEYRAYPEEENMLPRDFYVILVGEDTDNYTIRGYRDGGCSDDERLDDLSCTVTRTEGTLGEVLVQLMDVYLHEYCVEWPNEAPEIPEHLSLELYADLAAEVIYTYSELGSSPVARYEFGMLEDIFSDTLGACRVNYYSFAAQIPAGGSITVEARTCRGESCNYKNSHIVTDRCCDMATGLGSALMFTSQTASISGCDEIELEKQNFGFDLAKGVTETTLDMNEPDFWLELRKTGE